MKVSLKQLIIPFCLFILTFLVYKIVYPTPRNWYNHYYLLAKALLAGHFNLENIPSYLQDTIVFDGKTYVPFPLAPAGILALTLSIIPKISQQQLGILLASATIPLCFLVLKKFTKTNTALMLSLFLAFGTVFFWAAVVGTTWYFAHIVSMFFLLISLLLYFKKNDFLSGAFFALSALSRLPTLMAGLFFLLQLLNQRKRLAKFLIASSIFLPITLFYNYQRFGNMFETGYYQVYKQYQESPQAYTFLQKLNPSAELFDHMDPRNVPLHLITFFIYPPNISIDPFAIKPSPFGMGIFFTSPLLLLALNKPFKDKLSANLITAAIAIALVDFLHYMQGWVQFGYRFALDFLPFILILLASRFNYKNKIHAALFLISIMVCTWGTLMAIHLGW